MIKTFCLILMLVISPLIHANILDPQEDNPTPKVKLTTNMGEIVIQLDRTHAPVSTSNFINYVITDAYNNTVFHRVIEGFVIQGGGFDLDNKKLKTNKAIENESKNGLPNKRGSIAMARTSDPHSATNQFYFNMQDNTNLNGNDKNWGYAVFGQVISGFDVIKSISKVPASNTVPVQPVIIERAYLINP